MRRQREREREREGGQAELVEERVALHEGPGTNCGLRFFLTLDPPCCLSLPLNSSPTLSLEDISVNMFTSAFPILNYIILVMWALVQTEGGLLRPLQPSAISDLSPHSIYIYVYELCIERVTVIVTCMHSKHVYLCIGHLEYYVTCT